ncbi:MAG: alpha/beta hydrolase [Synergistaceae bacterium]|nr:alpha/beta hydrolase [Synergistaceae bacterium]
MGKLLFIMLALVLIMPAKSSGNAPEIETLRTASFTMDYFRFGKGNRTLVILPGISVKSVMNYAGAIEESYRLLAEDFTVCVMDRRKDIPARYSVCDMAGDTAEALRALGLSRVCVFGASQGGMMAMKLAADNPGLVDCMILGSTSAQVTPEQYSAVFGGFVRLAEEGNAEALSLAFGEAVYPREVFAQSRELLVESAKTVTPEDLSRFVIMTEGMRGFDVTDGLRKITCPVLVIGSYSDKVFGGDASVRIMELLGGRPGCELFMYDGYGHAAYDTAPDYRERMMNFLRKH